MIPIQPFIIFGSLFVAEKLRDTQRLSIFWAALIYALPVTFVQPLINLVSQVIVAGAGGDYGFGGILTLGTLVLFIKQYAGALVVLAFLSRVEDEVFWWLTTFTGGFIFLAFVL